MTIEFYRQLVQALKQAPVVLATVVRVRGSVPREVGAKMGIAGNGWVFNTIGGGAGEAKVIQQAQVVLETGEKQMVEIDLTGTMAAGQRQVEGICGGKMQVWLERWQGEGAIALVQHIQALLQAGQSVTLVTPFAAERPPNLLSGTAPALEDAFVETLEPPPVLLIVGAGHCGIQLTKVAHLVGFEVMVQDDRPEWANPQHYPQASQIFTDTIAATVAQLASHTQLYAALVTRGYKQDLAALEALLRRDIPCQYIGMIGSEKRVRQVYQEIEKLGISGSQLRSIYAPIGLDIGALTPEEIAVSISAELILVRRGGTGRSLSEPLRQRFNGLV
jgi:xanthine dehydrogenase accessory factor